MAAQEIFRDLALDYFRVGNGIVGFHVAQTILFLNSIHRSPALLAGIVKARRRAIGAAWVIAIFYAVVIVGCGCLEIHLREDGAEGATLVTITRCAIGGRLVVSVLLALGSSVVMALVKSPAPNLDAASSDQSP